MPDKDFSWFKKKKKKRVLLLHRGSEKRRAYKKNNRERYSAMYGRDIARRERMMGEQKNVMGDLGRGGESVEKKFLVE